VCVCVCVCACACMHVKENNTCMHVVYRGNVPSFSIETLTFNLSTMSHCSSFVWQFQNKTHLSFRSLRSSWTSVVFSVLLHGVNELLSSSSQEGNPWGAGVDTSFHNLERKRWSRGGGEKNWGWKNTEKISQTIAASYTVKTLLSNELL